MATPSSNRRSSISSVTSSGRQRKDQSLQGIADSLGQRTPECSQTSEEGVSKRSRQLDFGSDNCDVEGEQGDAEVQEVQANEAVAEENIQVEDAHRPRRGRRVTVFWSEEEEKLLRRGVEKFGIGNWKKILLDGKDVFSSHRTNIDLKDKWKNLCRSTTRKRRRTSCTSNPPENATENEEQQAISVTRSKTPSDETSEISSPESATPRPHRRGAASAAKKKANAEHLPAEEDGDHRAEGDVADANGLFSGHVTLKLATDKTVPKLVEVSVDLDTYKDVYALKAILRSSLLSDAPPDEDIKVIGLKSRVVFKDQEHLSRCIQINGVEFFFVFEENPDEFV